MAKNMRNLRGFTLAEVMIVLTVIGVLTAILLPVARQSMPDENLMKFKKAHNTLGTVIRELVTSDKYYKDGDLGIKPDDTLIDGTHNGDNTYLCRSIADVINTKSVKCSEKTSSNQKGFWSICWGEPYQSGTKIEDMVDEVCNAAQGNSVSTIGPDEGIITNDGVVFYETAPSEPFGWIDPAEGVRIAIGADKPNCGEDSFVEAKYKFFCIDIDGIPNNTKGYWECGNECPFGYGIRWDGKILVGTRAQEWLKKGVNEE